MPVSVDRQARVRRSSARSAARFQAVGVLRPRDAFPACSDEPCRVRHPLHGRAQGRRCGSRSEEHTSELQSLMRISYAVFCLKKKKTTQNTDTETLTNTAKVL